MPLLKYRNSMQHYNLLQPSFHLQWSKWCQMRMIDVFNARNQDTLHDTVFTSDAMNVKNTDI